MQAWIPSLITLISSSYWSLIRPLYQTKIHAHFDEIVSWIISCRSTNTSLERAHDRTDTSLLRTCTHMRLPGASSPAVPTLKQRSRSVLCLTARERSRQITSPTLTCGPFRTIDAKSTASPLTRRPGILRRSVLPRARSPPGSGAATALLETARRQSEETALEIEPDTKRAAREAPWDRGVLVVRAPSQGHLLALALRLR